MEVAKPRILFTHPGETSYHDNTLWYPLAKANDPDLEGIWLKPGEAIAVVKVKTNP